jgi:catechol 2,3-dioxygenase-like lactoylglutathione lyase family enzyme
MSVELNHTIVWCHDTKASSAFLADILGRPAPVAFHHFMVVDLDNNVSIDFMEKTGDVTRQHYAFLIGEADFDAAFARIKERKLTYWADPACTQPNTFNTHDGGRGLYFEDPNGHLLEIITRPYGR